MPTWSAPAFRDELSQNTRSPTWRSPFATALPPWPCWYEIRGRLMPNCFITYCVKPEQSNPDGDVPPHTYGVPMNCCAKSAIPLRPPPCPGAGRNPPPETLVDIDV